MYLVNATDVKPKGQIDLGQYTHLVDVPTNMIEQVKGFGFALETPTRTYIFSAETAEDRDLWRSKIGQVLAGSVEYNYEGMSYRSPEQKEMSMKFMSSTNSDVKAKDGADGGPSLAEQFGQGEAAADDGDKKEDKKEEKKEEKKEKKGSSRQGSKRGSKRLSKRASTGSKRGSTRALPPDPSESAKAGGSSEASEGSTKVEGGANSAGGQDDAPSGSMKGIPLPPKKKGSKHRSASAGDDVLAADIRPKWKRSGDNCLLQ